MHCLPKEIELKNIYTALFSAAEGIYIELKKGSGLEFLETNNESGDDQIVLDVFADELFHEKLKKCDNIKYIISEERPSLDKINDGNFSITLDPLDGSKSALVGIPSGAIFGIFSNTDTISDFNGSNIIGGGFFVFGINLEVYFSDNQTSYKAIWNQTKNTWSFTQLKPIPSAKFIAINASNKNYWEIWLQKYYENLIDIKSSEKPYNLRWYASMVSGIKRLILQGGLFAYPNDNRIGYDNGHLRLVYEAIPMAYLVESIGGASSNGNISLLETKVSELHQKTPVFIGETKLIEDIENSKKNT